MDFGHILKSYEEVEELEDSQMREEFRKDAHFVGCRCDRPIPSFYVGYDMYVGYFVTDGDFCPFWLARALMNRNLDPKHVNSNSATILETHIFSANHQRDWDTNKEISGVRIRLSFQTKCIWTIL